MKTVFVVAVILICILTIPYIIICIADFVAERRYLLIEIKRSSGDERREWKKQLRLLYLTMFFPNVRNK